MQIQLNDKEMLEYVGKAMLCVDNMAFPRYKLLLEAKPNKIQLPVNYSKLTIYLPTTGSLTWLVLLKTAHYSCF